MGACIRDILLASEERECGGDIDLEELSDSDGEDVEPVFVAMPRGHQRVETPGFLKRTYGILAYDSSLERKRKHAKLDEQLDGLRAVVPSSTRLRGRTESVVVDAYRYIATLQRQVEDLSAELLEDTYSALTQEKESDERTLSSHSDLDQKPMVEVMRRDEFLEVRIVCANRPGLLVDVMEAVESRGLTVTHARISCHGDIVFEYLSLENEESATISSTEGAKEADAEEVDSVKAMLVHAICK